VLNEEADNWGILHDPENDFSFGINPLGVLTWKILKICKSKVTVDQLCELVLEKCNNAPPDAKKDILKFLTTLVTKNVAFVETGIE